MSTSQNLRRAVEDAIYQRPKTSVLPTPVPVAAPVASPLTSLAPQPAPAVAAPSSYMYTPIAPNAESGGYDTAARGYFSQSGQPVSDPSSTWTDYGQDSAQYLDPKALAALGYSGALTAPMSGDMGGGLSPDLVNFLNSKYGEGWTIGGDYGTGYGPANSSLFSKQGNNYIKNDALGYQSHNQTGNDFWSEIGPVITAAIGGAYAGGAFGGAGAAAGEGAGAVSGMDLAADAGSLGANSVTAAGNALGGGLSSIAPTVAQDPIGAYLTTGASDASTVGGAGGYAGAVGANAAPEVLGATTLPSSYTLGPDYPDTPAPGPNEPAYSPPAPPASSGLDSLAPAPAAPSPIANTGSDAHLYQPGGPTLDGTSPLANMGETFTPTVSLPPAGPVANTGSDAHLYQPGGPTLDGTSPLGNMGDTLTPTVTLPPDVSLGGLGSLLTPGNLKNILPLLNSLFGPSAQQPAAAPAPTAMAPSTSGALGQSAARYTPSTFVADSVPTVRPGHTMGPSTAVNLHDPSAAMFGYGKEPLYYQRPGLAEGGSVSDYNDEGAYSLPVASSGYGGPPDTGTASLGDLEQMYADPGGSPAPRSGIADWWHRYLAGDKRAQGQGLLAINGLAALSSLFNKRQRQASPSELTGTLSGNRGMNAAQSAMMDRYFNAPASRFVAPPPVVTTGRPGYEHGGYIAHGSGGQADDVPINASHGEYVFDADTVAALGDGSNEHGAKLLDNMREHIRAHKRSAPATEIPPKALSPLEYLKGR